MRTIRHTAQYFNRSIALVCPFFLLSMFHYFLKLQHK